MVWAIYLAAIDLIHNEIPARRSLYCFCGKANKNSKLDFVDVEVMWQPCLMQCAFCQLGK